MLEGVSFVFIKDKLVKMRVHDGQVTKRMPELYYSEMHKFSNAIIDDYIIPSKLSDRNIESFLSYQYRNNNKEIYKRIEALTNSRMHFRKLYYMAYGKLFNLIRFIYSKTLKK